MKIKDKYPFLPTSVIHLDRTSKRQDLRKMDTRTDDARMGDEYAFSSSRSKFGNFDPLIGEFILSYFNRDKALTLDPFAGWGERAIVARNMGIEYVGIDISPLAIDYARRQHNVTNINANALQLPFHDDSFGFCFTCPPYWNLEKYESVNGQLSDNKNYHNFLGGIYAVSNELSRTLAENSLCALVVGDFRSRGIFHDFSTDVCNIFRGSGFSTFDRIILDKYKRYRLPLFLQQAERLGYTVKVHEYILVFRNNKPRK